MRWRTALMAAALIALAAQSARAADDCPGGAVTPRILLRDQGTLESVIVDPQGRLVYTNDNALLRLDRPDATPKVLTDVPGRGGLELTGDGKLFVGADNDNQSAIVSGRPESGGQGATAQLWIVDPETGAHTVYASGLTMANGIARGPDGAVYASNDFSPAGIARVAPGGQVQNFWSPVNSANGLVIDRAGRYLYAAQTFQPAAVARVDLAHPERVETYFAAEGADMPAGPDGLTRDQHDRLYVAANGAGQVWRIDGPGRMCVLARGLLNASSLIFGSGDRGFQSTSLYVVTFTGLVVELPMVRDAPSQPAAPPRARARQRLTLRVRPRRLVVGRRARVVFLVRATGRAVAGARVHFAGRTVRTNRAGRATIVVTLHRAGPRRAWAYRSGFLRAVPVRVLVRR